MVTDLRTAKHGKAPKRGGNGATASRGRNGQAVAKQRQSNGKLLGGCTGKGFLPGRSGNPEGRKPGSSVTARLLRILEQDDGKVAEAIAAVIIREALRGKFAFAKEILDRVDGKVPHRVTVQDCGPLFREVVIGLDRV